MRAHDPWPPERYRNRLSGARVMTAQARFLLAAAMWAAAALGTALAEQFDDEDELDAHIAGIELGSDQLMFIIKSNHPNIVDVEFYSQSRRHAWPGGNQVYNIDDDDWHTFVLNCRPGEKICYGAGVRGDYSRYWGVGIGGRQGCRRCCYTCDGIHSDKITLDP
jgi:hypothetical protein